MHIVIGDANGVDKAVQNFLLLNKYNQVTVYCSGEKCRNNLGNWHIHFVEVAKGIKGRDFFTIKDKAMAKIADYGFALWDGKSQGTLNNINELANQNKKTLLYHSPSQSFITINRINDLHKLAPQQITGFTNTNFNQQALNI